MHLPASFRPSPHASASVEGFLLFFFGWHTKLVPTGAAALLFGPDDRAQRLYIPQHTYNQLSDLLLLRLLSNTEHKHKRNAQLISRQKRQRAAGGDTHETTSDSAALLRRKGLLSRPSGMAAAAWDE
ncbi:putative c2 domain protein [Anopheles sinensis]|uniref:Putative c2 domain protein n=1 Tax=Anopheles sinensis TaxID=74873 RepID=A0A084VQI8_ANOSI|nr:putative c2 domain protein [Anopheles sinensis]